uniref:LOV domain-containing protein n=1 Tax=Helicotheca tamesis TaxID=374047 RepID=A0A7S2MF67_9STRA|mmetsp:Transcript_15031/g.20467  ORF Transcript_15031/g.20467 Transcript_15031/m.20467 type:complete len:513 (+) Transcript_15031:330-1868(+)|eukprot:CAMPEP_0185734674 /NCGR_PEP_ID=MMETSP1171-20130828/23164_1 /TAXON_ID=374046 /ORGANISM="Helicotheca tamensis, Strain CCMP826" /LENGTH=512 /DNA_ID=CAMNT_0028404735 /DNA_START=279 /DNA_END=1817 /DNA_ORIENTATION=+
MSDPQNVFQNSGVQKPMFAPKHTQLGDDIDLNDIFADYFINELEDPLTSYANSVSKYSGAAAAVALAQQQQQAAALAAAAATPQTAGQAAPAPSLPTGRGIQTAWHSGALPNVSGTGALLQAQVDAQAPAAKKAKLQAPQDAMQGIAPQNHAQAAAPMEAPVGAPVAGSQNTGAASGLSGRLGFSMVGGQLALPQQGGAVQQQQQAGAPAAQGNVTLPVGMGIRVGGAGGVVPHGAAGGNATLSHTQWNAGAQQLSHVQHGQPPGQYLLWNGVAGGMSDQAVAERRQRNREHAKRSRVRKKFMLESLQEQVRGLQKENVHLRMLIQEKIPQHAQKIIDECCQKNSLFDETQTNGEKSEEPRELVRSDFSLIESLTSGQQNFVLSDPRLPDNPIVFASPGFYELTGYTQDQVLGRNCRFLQGPGTDPRAVDVIRTAIANGTDATTCLLNYKADGTPFWNQFFVAALRDADNCIVNYVGVQTMIEPEAGASALEDKVNSVLPLQLKGDSGDNPK